MADDQKPERIKDLRKAVFTLRAALETAPNPRVIDGPPALWEWYDGVRQAALENTKEI